MPKNGLIPCPKYTKNCLGRTEHIFSRSAPINCRHKQACYRNSPIGARPELDDLPVSECVVGCFSMRASRGGDHDDSSTLLMSMSALTPVGEAFAGYH